MNPKHESVYTWAFPYTQYEHNSAILIVRRPIKNNDTLQSSRSLIGVQADSSTLKSLGISHMAGNNDKRVSSF
jgi:hypothetical protein